MAAVLIHRFKPHRSITNCCAFAPGGFSTRTPVSQHHNAIIYPSPTFNEYTGAGPPLPHHNFGCLTLRGFRRVSTTDFDTLFIHHIQRAAFRGICPNAQSTPSLLRRRIFALYHHQLLPTPRVAWQPEKSRPLSPSVGAGTAPLSFCGRGLRSHARACASALRRTRAWQSIDRDASHKTGFCAASLAQPSLAARSSTRTPMERISRGWTHLAAPLLRLCGIQREEASRKIALYAPQSRQTRIGAGAGTVGGGQFPVPCRRRCLS